jgi:hypothetical protein
MFGRRKTKLALPDEEEVLRIVLHTAHTLGEPGAAITPDLLALAGQVSGAEAASHTLRAGGSLDQCSLIREFYNHVGRQAGKLFEPAGPLHEATIPENEAQ